ncbi:MAG: MoaD/ThiS family protein [Proteobacteria bacterium]|nr:MoaD/ThiS family protein [Pseudomonadota bacterium]
MKVKVMFLGPLAEFIGRPTVEFDLPDKATYGDLLDDIGSRFGDKLHPRIWDHEKRFFKAQVLVVGAGRDHEARETPLLENEDIKIIPFLPGG